ncbi:MAG TPA: inositol monophosphatase family protein [Gemmatimonadales bacterium]|nr:inositol monophosphatase family protein [Gemmatimonadales bacterium]
MDRARLARALELAVAAATAPRARILASFRSPALRAEAKADGSPVTAADRDAEAIVRAALRGSPEFGGLEILGEEGGLEGGPSPFRWIIDPIDGTRGYARGLPTFGTIVALEETASARALVGVIHLPASGETVSAARGLGCFRDGRPARASAVAAFEDAILSAPDLAQFREAGCPELYHWLHGSFERVRGYTDCWAHVQAVGGALDVVIDPGLSPWDVRATQVLIEEAGGKQLVRPSHAPGKVDVMFGSPALVEALAQRLGFCG